MAETNYWEGWGLVRDPFASDLLAAEHFLAERWQEYLRRLTHLSRYGNQLLAITGAKGSGKSTLKQALLSRFDPSQVVYELSPNTVSDNQTFLTDIAAGLHLDTLLDKKFADDINTQVDAHMNAMRRRGQNCVLIIDAAEDLLPSCWQVLQAFVSSERKVSANFHIIVLLENDKLLSKFNDEEVYQLALTGFNEQELSDFLKYRFKQAGAPDNWQIKPELLQQILHISKGLPGAVGDAARQCLLASDNEIAAAESESQNTAATTHQATRAGNKNSRWLIYFVAFVFCFAVVYGAVYYWQARFMNKAPATSNKKALKLKELPAKLQAASNTKAKLPTQAVQNKTETSKSSKTIKTTPVKQADAVKKATLTPKPKVDVSTASKAKAGAGSAVSPINAEQPSLRLLSEVAPIPSFPEPTHAEQLQQIMQQAANTPVTMAPPPADAKPKPAVAENKTEVKAVNKKVAEPKAEDKKPEVKKDSSGWHVVDLMKRERKRPAPPKPANTSGYSYDELAFLKFPGNHYVVQLYTAKVREQDPRGTKARATAERYVKRQKFDLDQTFVIRTVSRGQPAAVVVYGNFSSSAAASRAMLRRKYLNKGMIRRVNQLQRALRKVRAEYN